jgi:accessory gene regulator protein AgrB
MQRLSRIAHDAEKGRFKREGKVRKRLKKQDVPLMRLVILMIRLVIPKAATPSYAAKFDSLPCPFIEVVCKNPLTADKSKKHCCEAS